MCFEGDRRFDIVVRLPDDCARISPASKTCQFLCLVKAPAKTGELASGLHPAQSRAEFEMGEGPNQISRENGKRRVVVQANVRGRDIGSFVAEAQAKIDAQVKFPRGAGSNGAGSSRICRGAQPTAHRRAGLLLRDLPDAVHGLRNAREALLVFSGVPLAISGGILTLYFWDMPFSISAAVGFIALSGIAVLNGLVMVTYINQLRLKGWRAKKRSSRAP